MIGLSIDKLSVGQSARFSKTITETDIYLYAGISGDFNPAHVNEQYAAKTFFKTRIAHGMLTASFISTLIGTILPGPGSIYMRQELNFLAPVKIGEICPPQSVKRNSTPCSRKTFPMISPQFISMMPRVY